jgi:hypothetical protein
MTRTEKQLTRNVERAQKLYAHLFCTNPFPGRDEALACADTVIWILRRALLNEQRAPARHHKGVAK